MRKTVDELLRDARARLRRLSPSEALSACDDGAVLVDIRDTGQVTAQGRVPGAVWIPRNVLEWRVDPSSGHQHPALAGREDSVILLCAEGYQSSLAAATLHELGFEGSTDVIGGFAAWQAAGLPVERDDEGARTQAAPAPAAAPTSPASAARSTSVSDDQ